MDQPFKNVRMLHQEGLLHKKLLNRIRLLTAISIALLVLGAYDAVKDQLHGYILIAISILAFTLGIALFSRISPVVWDEEKEIIAAGRMDITSIGILLLYILFDFGVKSFLKAHYADVSSITGYVLAAFGASLLGRSIGTRLAVYHLARTSRDPMQQVSQ